MARLRRNVEKTPKQDTARMPVYDDFLYDDLQEAPQGFRGFTFPEGNTPRQSVEDDHIAAGSEHSQTPEEAAAELMGTSLDFMDEELPEEDEEDTADA